MKKQGPERENMTLQELLGEELFSQIDAKIQEHNNGIKDKLQHIRFVDLSEGGYISKEKYQTEKTRADGLDGQLKTANTEIQSYKDMDIEGIKKKAGEWETKYAADTQTLQEKLDQQAYDFEAERYLGKYKFRSELARKAALAEFRDKKFQMQNGAFLGADDFMNQMKESDPEAFTPDEGQQQTRYQAFVRGTAAGYKPQQVGDEKAILDQKYANNPYYKK